MGSCRRAVWRADGKDVRYEGGKPEGDSVDDCSSPYLRTIKRELPRKSLCRLTVVTTQYDLCGSQLPGELFDIFSSSLKGVKSHRLGRNCGCVGAAKSHYVRADDPVAELK